MDSANVLGMRVDCLSMEFLQQSVLEWSSDNKGRYVCVSNVHMCMEAVDNVLFSQILDASSLTIPDGRPIFWSAHNQFSSACQLRGYDVTLALFRFAEAKGLTIGFYGGNSDAVLDRVERYLVDNFPSLQLVYRHSPPFRPLLSSERREVIKQINTAKPDILFVGLGCPKQERWMNENFRFLSCTMFGVGAVIDFLSGEKKHAPKIMQLIGGEWVYRLIQEPKRLWRRYLYTNTKFLFLFFKETIAIKRKKL